MLGGSHLSPVVLIAALVIGAATLVGMLPNRSFGASGDDSVGYILAAENLADGRVIYQDAAYRAVRMELGHEIAASFLPSHYVPVGEDGRVVSKYPIGFPSFLAAARFVFGHGGYSLVGPLMGAVAVAGVFLLCMEWFANERWRWLLSMKVVPPPA